MHIVKVRIGANVELSVEPSSTVENIKDRFNTEVTEEEVREMMDDEMDKGGFDDFLANVGREIEGRYVALLQKKLNDKGHDIDFPLEG